MAYDEELAHRTRELLADEDGLTEKAMFGGLAFLLDGNMSVGISGEELMVRAGPTRPKIRSPGPTCASSIWAAGR